MSGEFEAAGGLASAGLAGAAIDGSEAKTAATGPCANCGAELNGRYCSNCGQPAYVNRTLWHMIKEVVQGLFNFDTRAWRTLPMLIGRPGTLTHNYVFGKRARYFSPLATFLFCIFLMFFAVSFVDAPSHINLDDTDRPEAVQDLNEARADLASVQRDLAERTAHPDHDMPAGLEVRLAQQAVTLAQAEVTRREQTIARIDAAERARQAAAAATPAGQTPAAPPPAVAPQTWQEQLSEAARKPDFVHIDGMPQLSERIRQKFLNPDLTLYRLGEAASKFSFLLVPISLPFIAFLFLFKRNITLYDHTVFTLYSVAFASLLITAVVLVAQTKWTAPFVPFLICAGLPVHTFFHLKGAYALGWWSALWRTVFMLFFALICALIYFVIILVLGLSE